MKALIADDSRVSRRVLVGVLRHDCGFAKIVEAADGKEALERAREGTYDLICLDWNMPELTGIDVLRAIRESDNETPVMMITSETEKARVAEAFDAGASNYLVKPFGNNTLVDKIRQTLHKDVYAQDGKSEGRTALIADDSAVMRKLLAGMLTKRCGFSTVVQAADGKEALTQAAGQKFDLITLDWNMPEPNGIETLRAIRQKDTATPVIMVTSEKDGARVAEALEVGANHYIIKPFEPEVVAKKIRQVFREKH